MTKLLMGINVLEAAKNRIRWLFDQYPGESPVVSFSGGKDSTICLNLACEIAKERGLGPVDVAFLDQETEWSNVVAYMRRVAARPDVNLHWFQAPFTLTNNASAEAERFTAWGDGERHMRAREPGAITDLGMDTKEVRFHNLFEIMLRHIRGEKPAAFIGGMRAEESPVRMMTLTGDGRYQGVTWVKRLTKKREHHTFHPIYDWTYRDVWKAIHDGGWDYCRIYDLMFKHGVQIRRMRVSNLNHETSLDSLRYLQELEPATWDALCQRLPGIHAGGTMAAKFFPTELPEMFATWREYRDHLLENLIQPHMKPRFLKEFDRLDRKYRDKGMQAFDAVCCRVQCQAIAVNDFSFTKIQGWEFTKEVDAFRRWLKGHRGEKQMVKNKFIPAETAQ
jgi:predicted phosphoadenosine phosphosulfate sulfurtransferase